MGEQSANHRSFKRAVLLVATLLSLFSISFAQPPPAKEVGTVKSVNGNSLVITTDSGSEQTVTFADSARILRASPGQNDLKTAPAISVSDIQAGDRVVARGEARDGGVMVASSAIIMKQSDLAERQQRERDEWRSGVGGIVKQVDPAAGTVTVANAMVASGKPIVIHIAPDTAIRRYSPDSVKFDDAKLGTLDQVKPGDQLRARGTKNADGTELNAQAIVSGTFREIAGTVVSTDVTNGRFAVMDLATKKLLTIKVGPDSQLRKLPQMMAQMIALRLRGGVPENGSAQNGPAEQGRLKDFGTMANRGEQSMKQPKPQSAGAPGTPNNERAGLRQDGGAPRDFQQMLSRIPAVSLSDLVKGDAVMLVATEGSSSLGPTAITLLVGVEPILSAAPAGASASMILSPWNLGGSGGVGGEGSTE
jgi:hypothetical protein